MKPLNKIAAVAALTLAAFVAGPAAYAAVTSETLTINTTVTITVAVDITWWGDGNAGSTVDHTATNGIGATLAASTDSARSWNLTGSSGTVDGSTTIDQGSAFKSTASQAGGGAYDTLQFVVKNVGNARVDYTAMAVANVDANTVQWSTGTPSTNQFQMRISANDGTAWYTLTSSLSDPGAAFQNKAVNDLVTIDLEFTVPTTVTNAGVTQVIVTSIQGALG